MFYGSFKRSLKFTFDGIQRFRDQLMSSRWNPDGMNSSLYIQSALFTSINHCYPVYPLIRFWPCIMMLAIWTIWYERCSVSSQFTEIFTLCIFSLLLINLKIEHEYLNWYILLSYIYVIWISWYCKNNVRRRV